MARKVKINRKTDALVMIDVQPTFCPRSDVPGSGELPVPEGDQVITPLNAVSPLFKTQAASQDWHPENHCSFISQGGPFPLHGVRETPGAELHPSLNTNGISIRVKKGFEQDRDELCCFCGDPALAEILPKRIKCIFIGGLATEYCVWAAAIHARILGYDVFVIEDAIRAVDTKAGESAIREMKANGVKFVRSENLIAL